MPYFLRDNGGMTKEGYKLSPTLTGEKEKVINASVNASSIPVPVNVASMNLADAQSYAAQYYNGGIIPKSISTFTQATDIDSLIKADLAKRSEPLMKYGFEYAKRDKDVQRLMNDFISETDYIKRKDILSKLQFQCGEIAAKDLQSWGVVDGLNLDGVKAGHKVGSDCVMTTDNGVDVNIKAKQYDLVTFRGASGQTYQFPLGVSKADVLVNAGELEDEFVKLPSWMQKNNKGFVFINEDHPMDAYYQLQYDNFKRGAMYSSDPITVHLPSDAKTATYLARHEISHHIYNKYVNEADWIKAINDDTAYFGGVDWHPTEYAKNAPTEDFADSLRFVSMGGAYDAAMKGAPNRYAFLMAVLSRL